MDPPRHLCGKTLQFRPTSTGCMTQPATSSSTRPAAACHSSITHTHTHTYTHTHIHTYTHTCRNGRVSTRAQARTHGCASSTVIHTRQSTHEYAEGLVVPVRQSVPIIMSPLPTKAQACIHTQPSTEVHGQQLPGASLPNANPQHSLAHLPPPSTHTHTHTLSLSLTLSLSPNRGQ